MKIKEVCEKTNLTSRTIRFYIEENLISPEYTENYLGRKTFSFSDVDVIVLSHIAVLRKFGFSIAEIRKIIESEDNSSAIIKAVCSRKEKTIQEEAKMLSVLLQLNDGKCYTLEEIARTFNTCISKNEIPKDDTIPSFMFLLRHPREMVKRVSFISDRILLLISFALSVFFIVYYFAEWKYPRFTDVSQGILFLFLTSIPATIIFSLWLYAKVVSKKQLKRKLISKVGLISGIIMLVSFLPMCVIGLIRPVVSLTTDMANYREIDEYESAVCDNGFYNELFPIRPKGAVRKNNMITYPESNYYYRCRAAFNFTVDIYAEWCLEDVEFHEEVDRVKKLYSAYEILDEDETDYRYSEIQKGDYTCLIRYDGGTPFTEEKEDYYYFIFAYNEEDLRVRYILCYSGENGADQPYYLQLDW